MAEKTDGVASFRENKIELCFHALAPTGDIKGKSKGDEVVLFL